MKLSKFGEQFSQPSGIARVMDDIGEVLAQEQQTYMLGVGDPDKIPAMQAHFRERMQAMLTKDSEFEQTLGNYDMPQGNSSFVEALAELLADTYGWPITAANIALSNGSQAAFFSLFNLFAGVTSDGRQRKILLPLMPEYTGYADLGLTPDIFVSHQPELDYLGAHTFKYRIDFERLHLDDNIGAICISRPTNPTGNVITDDEVAHLSSLARQHGIPLIIDGAYGMPFPNILFTEAQAVWDEHIILCLSLSKFGLPGLRTGIVIASEETIRAFSNVNARMTLAPGSFGPSLAAAWVHSGDLIRLSNEIIQPHYQSRMAQAVDWTHSAMGDAPFYIHKPEGAFFLWMWFKDLPIPSTVLYERLKARGVMVVPGEYFFFGLEDAHWQHRYECLRVSYAQQGDLVKTGIGIIGEEVQRAYSAS